MHANDLDSAWFHSNPDREYRLRRQTPAELVLWPVPPREGLTGWCIIRRTDGGVELFAMTTGETWGDCDDELAPFFNDLRGNEAA